MERAELGHVRPGGLGEAPRHAPRAPDPVVRRHRRGLPPPRARARFRDRLLLAPARHRQGRAGRRRQDRRTGGRGPGRDRPRHVHGARGVHQGEPAQGQHHVPRRRRVHPQLRQGRVRGPLRSVGQGRELPLGAGRRDGSVKEPPRGDPPGQQHGGREARNPGARDSRSSPCTQTECVQAAPPRRKRTSRAGHGTARWNRRT